MPHNDPLAGWKKENIAAPRRPEHQIYDIQESIYDDTPVPIPLPVPAPQAVPLQELQSPLSNRYLQPPPIIQPERGRVERKVLTSEEKRRCPHGDTRWPPPNEAHSKPLQLRYEEKGERRKFYYHLIYENHAPEVAHWLWEISSMAKDYYEERMPDEPPTNEPGKTKAEIERANEEARLITARSAFMAAKMQQRSLRELSKGPRGTIWILDEGGEHIWQCIEIAQKASPHMAISTGPGCQERFSIFGIGLKQNKWDTLLISEKLNTQ